MEKTETLSIYSFMELFPNEEKATEFFEGQIWGDAPICPYCESIKTASRKNRKGHRCKDCRKDFTVRIGTIFENSRLPLHKWLYAMYLLATACKGISSLQLAKEIGITQKSAWFCYNDLEKPVMQIQAFLRVLLRLTKYILTVKKRINMLQSVSKVHKGVQQRPSLMREIAKYRR